MKQPFSMTNEEFEAMKAIAQDRTPVMKFGDYVSGMDKQERANSFWKELGKKYSFAWDSVPGNGRDPKDFVAEPLPQMETTQPPATLQK